jgi:hypothetical protein
MCSARNGVEQTGTDTVTEGNQLRRRGKEAGRRRLAQIGLRPLALNVDEASAMCGLSSAQFVKEVAAGNLPPPIGGLLSKRKLWSVAALERTINNIDTGQSNVDNDQLMREIKSRAARVA